jgi:hypothetical protein
MSTSFLRVLECFGGVLMGLFREFVSGEMVAFAVGRGSGLVSVSSLVVELGGAVVRALGHRVSPLRVGCSLE